MEGPSTTPTVCILAAGRGSRLGESSKTIHKALLPLANKAVISRIIAQFPGETHFVIAVGCKAAMIRDFLALAHPDLKVTFVTVDNFDGPGAGPGYSLYCCRDWLDKPFLFTACDTLITSPLPPLEDSWIGVREVDDIARWCSVEVDGRSRVTALHYKRPGVNTRLAYVGIAFVADARAFWQGLEADLGEPGDELQVNGGLMALAGAGLTACPLAWEDTGDAESYHRLLQVYGDNYTFPGKVNEFTYRYGDQILKLCGSPKLAADRFHRGLSMKGVFPEVVDLRGNLFSYRFQDGELLSSRLDGAESSAFLDWAQRVLWKDVAVDRESFERVRHDFYVAKTLQRLSQFVERFASGAMDRKTLVINEVSCRPTAELVERAFEALRGKGIPSTYHGDLHADNIVKTADGYRLIDWRHAFGNSRDVGDRYYDLAKFLHTLDLSTETMARGKYEAVARADAVTIRHETRARELEARGALFAFLAKRGYSQELVGILNGLIFLNMAPLYASETAQYLYFFGRYLLEKAVSGAMDGQRNERTPR